jgi:hypothetical protein
MPFRLLTTLSLKAKAQVVTTARSVVIIPGIDGAIYAVNDKVESRGSETSSMAFRGVKGPLAQVAPL